nr:MAG TPA: hypothetical protein [Caudoviricetes sp.]
MGGKPLKGHVRRRGSYHGNMSCYAAQAFIISK